MKNYHDIKNIRGAGHFKPQFNKYSANFFHEIIKVENLTDEVERINKKYNLELNCNFNSSHWKSNYIANEEVDTKNYSDISWSIIESKIQSNELPEYNLFYDNESRALVEKIYAQDIKVYFSI